MNVMDQRQAPTRFFVLVRSKGQGVFWSGLFGSWKSPLVLSGPI